MTAGVNIKGNIYRMYTPQDDDQGGAVPTGTVIYHDVWARVSPMQPTLALLEQGLETPTIYNGIFQYVAPNLPNNISGTFEVLHNDQYEITWPPIDVHYGKKFVIISVQYQSYNDPRKYVVTRMRRLETANAPELQ